MAEPLLDENNNNEVDLNSKMNSYNFIDTSTKAFIDPSINPSINGIVTSTNSFIDPSINSFIDPSINSFIDPSINAFIDPSINSFIDPSTNELIKMNTSIISSSPNSFTDDVRDDYSNTSETESGNAYSISTNSCPPEDPDRINEKTDTETEPDTVAPEVFLQCKVKKLEAEVDSLRTQLSRVGMGDRGNGPEDRTKQEREKCVVFKCIPQAHITSEVFQTKIAAFFKISSDQLTVQITDQLNKWCVVVLHTPDKHDASRILRNFGDFRKLYQCYHRTQALPCFSNNERKLYQQLWAEAIERNNREGYRSWEVDAQELRLVETVGIRQKWKVKVHYYPEDDSPTASTSALEVRRRQKGHQSPKMDRAEEDQKHHFQHPQLQHAQQLRQRRSKRPDKKRPTDPKIHQLMGQHYHCEGYECIQPSYVSHYVPQMPAFPGCHNYYLPQSVFNGISYYSQPMPTASADAPSTPNIHTSTHAAATANQNNLQLPGAGAAPGNPGNGAVPATVSS